MENQKLNLFIVDDNKLLATDLKLYLENKFSGELVVSIFIDGESCLKMINEQTHIVILDYFLEGKNGLEILEAIKVISPKTEVVMLSGNEDMAIAIQTFRSGAKDYVIKGKGSLRQLAQIVTEILLTPIKIIVREFGVSKFLAIFLVVFVIMWIVVVFSINLI